MSAPDGSKSSTFLRDALGSLSAYALGGVICLIGATAGRVLSDAPQTGSILDAIQRADVGHYVSIVEDGYSYSPDKASTVAFFPLYPLIAWCLAAALGVQAVTALLIVSHVCLAASSILALRYVRLRGQMLVNKRPTWMMYVLLLYTVFPPTFFFRLPYTEAMFLAVLLLLLLAMAKGWNSLWVALLAGLLSAVRPVGLAASAGALLYSWQRTVSLGARLCRMAIMTPLAIWGLVAYMVYLGVQFDQPLAFAKTRENWRIRPTASPAEQAFALLSGEPLWLHYLPGSYNWRSWGGPPWILNLQFANAIVFVGAAVALVVGFTKRWITDCEALISIWLLVIPYITRGYLWGSGSQARFAAVVFPVYVVYGRLLTYLPRAVAEGLLVLQGAMLALYTACFVAGEPFF